MNKVLSYLKQENLNFVLYPAYLIVWYFPHIYQVIVSKQVILFRTQQYDLQQVKIISCVESCLAHATTG